jgi:hypothetical protein
VEFPAGFEQFHLLAQRAVQQDLNLSDKQTDQVQRLIKHVIDKQAEFDRPLTPGQNEQAESSIQALLRSAYEANALLTPKQGRRLQEINLQATGTASFWPPPVCKKLFISDRHTRRCRFVPYGKQAGDETSEVLARLRLS